MLRDPLLATLLEQAARNLSTLELLARAAREQDLSALRALQRRVEELKIAYTKETNALMRQVLARAVEHRREADRRHAPRREAVAPLPGVR